MGFSGPWGPSLTPVGALGVPGANARQRQTGTHIQWVPVLDSGSLAPQDLPFWITGHRLPMSGNPRVQIALNRSESKTSEARTDMFRSKVQSPVSAVLNEILVKPLRYFESQ